MPGSLRNRLSDLASSFASSVLTAIRGSSLEELLGETSTSNRPALRTSNGAAPARRRGRRLPRRSAQDIGQVVDRIASLLRENPKGLRAEEIRQKLGLIAKEMPRPIKEALDSGRVAKSGQKRATTYFLKGGGGPKTAAARGKMGASPRTTGRGGKRGARKRARAAVNAS